MLSCASPSCPRELVDDGLSGGLLVGRALRNDIHERINRCVDQAVYDFTTGVELSLKVHLQGAVGSDVGIDCGAFSSGVKVSAQAARSIG